MWMSACEMRDLLKEADREIRCIATVNGYEIGVFYRNEYLGCFDRGMFDHARMEADPWWPHWAIDPDTGERKPEVAFYRKSWRQALRQVHASLKGRLKDRLAQVAARHGREFR